MENKQTAVEWLIEQILQIPLDGTSNVAHLKKYVGQIEVFDQAKEMEMNHAIAFHSWMKVNDTPDNAERFFHYSDEDMYNEFLNQTYPKS